jgi:hypothetical protein
MVPENHEIISNACNNQKDGKYVEDMKFVKTIISYTPTYNYVDANKDLSTNFAWKLHKIELGVQNHQLSFIYALENGNGNYTACKRVEEKNKSFPETMKSKLQPSLCTIEKRSNFKKEAADENIIKKRRRRRRKIDCLDDGMKNLH